MSGQTVEAKLVELAAGIKIANEAYTKYVQKSDQEQSAFVALKLVLNLQASLQNAIAVCDELLQDGNSAAVGKFRKIFVVQERRVAPLIEPLQQDLAEELIDLFDLKIMQTALSKLDAANWSYAQKFETMQSDAQYLRNASTVDDKRECLRVLGGSLAEILDSAFDFYSPIYGKRISSSYFQQNILSQKVLSLQERQDILYLLLSVSNLLFAYASDNRFKDVPIIIKEYESKSEAPVQSTIGELSEHLDAWLKAYNNTSKNTRRFMDEPTNKDKHPKPKKQVRFATQAEVQQQLVDHEGSKVGQIIGSEKVKFGSSFPSRKYVFSKAVKSVEVFNKAVNKFAEKTRMRRRNSTIVDRGDDDKPGPKHKI